MFPVSDRKANVWRLRREQVLGPCRRIGEGQHRFLDLLVGSRQPALVLTQVLLPRWHAEDLDEAVGSFSVAVEFPARASGPQAGLAEMRHRSEKVGLPLRGDDVLDGHQDRSRVGCRIKSHPGLAPVDSRLTVQVRRLRHRPDNAYVICNPRPSASNPQAKAPADIEPVKTTM